MDFIAQARGRCGRCFLREEGLSLSSLTKIALWERRKQLGGCWDSPESTGLQVLGSSPCPEAPRQSLVHRQLWDWTLSQKQNMICQKVLLSGIRYCLKIHANVCILLHKIGAPGSWAIFMPRSLGCILCILQGQPFSKLGSGLHPASLSVDIPLHTTPAGVLIVWSSGHICTNNTFLCHGDNGFTCLGRKDFLNWISLN